MDSVVSRFATAKQTTRHALDYALWRVGLWKHVGVPHILKRRIILEHRAKYDLRRFIETGTYLGDMLAALTSHFEELVSIELSADLHQRARHRFKDEPRVRLYQGDSASVLPDVLRSLREPALFWLDAHYSGGITARGALDSPVIPELRAVLAHPVPGHVLLIDDSRMFDGSNGYPTLDDLGTAVIHVRPHYTVTIADDIIRVSPPDQN